MSDTYDVIVVGGGPGGYVAAIRCAQLGLKTACVEKRSRLGGTCLNVGCIPSKALLHISEKYAHIKNHGAHEGILTSGLSIDWNQMMGRKQKVIEGLGTGIAGLFRKNKVTSIQGEGKLTSPHHVTVTQEGHTRTLEGKFIILALGSEPIPLPFLPFDEERVLSSTGALSLPSLPQKMLVVGAGVIGVELASVYSRLGTEVTIVELLDRVCPTADHEVSKALLKALQKQGMHFHLSTRVVEASAHGNGVSLTVSKGEERSTLEADVVMVSVGRRPYSIGAGLEEVGVQQDQRGFVLVNDNFQSSVPSVYAIGDLIDGPMLAHKASEEGVAVAEILAGRQPHIHYATIPDVVYTWPEVSGVGLSEQEAKEYGLQVRTGKFPFMAVSRARCTGEEDGFVKVVGDATSGRLIGVHIIGANASEMIAGATTAIEKQALVADIAHACFPHPTLSEGIKEACLACIDKPIHM